MTLPARLRVPAADFALTPFWQRLRQVARQQGHGDGHALQLVGQVEPSDRYTLRCLSCDQTAVEVTVDR